MRPGRLVVAFAHAVASRPPARPRRWSSAQRLPPTLMSCLPQRPC